MAYDDRDGLFKRAGTPYWWMTISLDGTRIRESTGVTSARKAKAIREERILALRTERVNSSLPKRSHRRSRRRKVFELAVEVYVDRQTRDNGNRASSYEFLKKWWTKVFAERQLDSIKTDEVIDQLIDWKQRRGWSAATYNNRLNQISGFFTFCQRQGWIITHPCDRNQVERLRVRNARGRYLTAGEVARVLETARRSGHGWLEPIVGFAVATGMRLGEICQIRRADIRDGAVWLADTKNREPHRYPLHGDLLVLVEQQSRGKGPADLLFPGPAGGGARMSIRRHLPGVVQAAGIPWGRENGGVTFHTFRHTMATLALANGVPRDAIQKLGNWRDPRMVARYAKVVDKLLDDGATRLAEVIPLRKPAAKASQSND